MAFPLALQQRRPTWLSRFRTTFPSLRPLHLGISPALASAVISRQSIAMALIMPWRGFPGYNVWTGPMPRYDYRMRRRQGGEQPFEVARRRPVGLPASHALTLPDAFSPPGDAARAAPWPDEEVTLPMPADLTQVAGSEESPAPAPLEVQPWPISPPLAPPSPEPPGEWLLPTPRTIAPVAASPQAPVLSRSPTRAAWARPGLLPAPPHRDIRVGRISLGGPASGSLLQGASESQPPHRPREVRPFLEYAPATAGRVRTAPAIAKIKSLAQPREAWPHAVAARANAGPVSIGSALPTPATLPIAEAGAGSREEMPLIVLARRWLDWKAPAWGAQSASPSAVSAPPPTVFRWLSSRRTTSTAAHPARSEAMSVPARTVPPSGPPGGPLLARVSSAAPEPAASSAVVPDQLPGQPLLATSADTPVAGEQPTATRHRPWPTDHDLPAAPQLPLASHRPAETQAQRDWPALGLIPRLATRAAHDEPTALHILRRMSPVHARPAMAALPALAQLGPGEPLPPSLRRPMERLLARDFSGVRIHTSPVAQELGAEALTSGERIVFAPGRMDLRSSHGLALLGHELAHVGQPLAFKQATEVSPALMDAEERAAQHQEAFIQRTIEQGWPEGPQMQVRRSAQPTVSPVASAAGSAGALGSHQAEGPESGHPAAGFPGSGPLAPLAESPGGVVAVQRAAQAGTSATPRPGGEAAPPGRAAPAPAAGAELDALARQVYAILKTRLRAERERHQLYSR